jgi:putative lipoic acid-binding regulatory protein
MSDMPLPELSFPCEYPLKVIGKDENNFKEFVVELVSRHVPGLPMEAFTTRSSRAGTYLSVSVTFIAESRAQVDALYQELGLYPQVLVAM